MPRQFNLKIRTKHEESEHQCSFEFPDDEIERLFEYTQYAQELEQTSIVRDGANLQLIIRGENATKSLKYSWTLPPDDDISALLHKLRPFVLENERTSFYRVVNILNRRLDRDEIRTVLNAQKYEYSGRAFLDQLSIKLDESPVNSEDMLKKWLNASEYHRDKDKQDELRVLETWFPNAFSRGLFISMIIDKARAILYIADFIRIMNEGGTGTFKYNS